MHTLHVSLPKIIVSRKSSNASLKVSFSPPDSRESKDSSSNHGSAPTVSTWRLGTVRASDTFDRIMSDVERRHAALEKKSSHEVAAAATDAAAAAAAATVTSLELNGDEEEDEEDDMDDETRERLRMKQVVERAWSLVRHQIVEMSFARRKGRSLSWSVLKHTLNTLKQGDSARQELYRKYLRPQHDPLAWSHGLDLLTVDVSKLATTPRVHRVQSTAASKSRAAHHVTPFTSRLKPGKWMSRVEYDLCRELNKTEIKH